MLKEVRPGLVLVVFLTLITGLLYPLAMTGLSEVLFPKRAQGSLIERDGKVIGICSATQAGRGYYIHLDEIQAALKRSGEGISWLVPPMQE